MRLQTVLNNNVSRDDTSLLKNHNIRIYYDLKREILEHKHVLLETCPGSGKSYITSQLIKNMSWNALILVTTHAIEEQWNTLCEKYKLNATVMTYQLFTKIKDDELSQLIDDFDIIVTDEAHHILANEWKNNLLYIRDNLQQYILGLTADSIRWTDSQIDVAEEFFKFKVIGYTFNDIYELKLAEPFTYICGVYDKEALKKSIVKNLSSNTDNVLVGKLCTSIDNVAGVSDILNKYKNKLPMHKIIVFVETRADLEEAQNYIRDLGCKIFTVHSSFGRSVNVKTLREFRDCQERAAIFCINILNEGVHIDGVDTVIMLRRTYVPNMYIQQIGRIVSIGAPSGTAVFDFVCNHINIANIYQFSFDNGNGLAKVRLKILSDQIIIDDYLAEVSELLTKVYSYRAGKPFEQWEDDIIREFYPKYGAEYCAALLPGRTPSSIQTRAYVLRIRFRNIVDWSDEMVATLKEEYEKGTSAAEISRLLNVSYDSLLYKMDMLGMSRVNKRLTPDEVEICKYLAKNTSLPGYMIAELLNSLPSNKDNNITWSKNATGIFIRDFRPDELKTSEWNNRNLKMLKALSGKFNIYELQEIFFPDHSVASVREACRRNNIEYLKVTNIFTVEEDIRLKELDSVEEFCKENNRHTADSVKARLNQIRGGFVNLEREQNTDKKRIYIKYDFEKCRDIYLKHGECTDKWKEYFPEMSYPTLRKTIRRTKNLIEKEQGAM